MNAVLQDPRGHTEAEIEGAILDGKVVFVQSYALHSTEVAASQSAAEIVYLFATRDDAEIREILDNTVSILIPAFNPDGVGIVNEWYDRWVGTEYEGASPPELYHHYIGHDNNRDAFMQNTVESFYGAQIMFREWIPQAYIDHHQMGPYTARIYLPPYAEPIRPEGDPLVWREMSWYGAHIAYKMEEAGLEGAVNAAIYSGWGHFGFHWITPFHNIAGDAHRIGQRPACDAALRASGPAPGLAPAPRVRGPDHLPEPLAGWLVARARHRGAADRRDLLTARDRREEPRDRAQERVQQGEPADPARAGGRREGVRDPGGATRPAHNDQDGEQACSCQGITVERAPAGFTHEGRVYGEGSYVVSMAQPKRGVIRWLLGQTYYPDNSYTRTADGDPIRPYDMSADVIAEFMGVRVDPVRTAVEAPLAVVEGMVAPQGVVAAEAPHGHRIDGTLNDAFKALNLLFDAGGGRAARDRVGGGCGRG